jgi:hypothetical protein
MNGLIQLSKTPNIIFFKRTEELTAETIGDVLQVRRIANAQKINATLLLRLITYYDYFYYVSIHKLAIHET